MPLGRRRNDSARRIVFVVGAGFSAELGYPTLRDLLPRLWGRLAASKREKYSRVIRFHHPGWDGRAATLPEVEVLLTEMKANEDLLPSFTPGGRFAASDLRRIGRNLVFEIASWFHEIHNYRRGTDTLGRFVARAQSSGATVISFNWDYELDKALFGTVSPKCYGLDGTSTATPVLLKPHGSLNWYRGKSGARIKSDRRVTLWEAKDPQESIQCFLRWRAPRSSRHRYIPWIVPPTQVKDFDHPMLKTTWQRCVEVLSLAKRVYFLGYSMPLADWHSRYILRCGFYNQVKGLPLDGRRVKPTGKAAVYVVNPDNVAFGRIESVVGWPCHWIVKSIREWLREDGKGT